MERDMATRTTLTAEEFLAQTTVGPWLPPERTVAPLAG